MPTFLHRFIDAKREVCFNLKFYSLELWNERNCASDCIAKLSLCHILEGSRNIWLFIYCFFCAFIIIYHILVFWFILLFFLMTRITIGMCNDINWYSKNGKFDVDLDGTKRDKDSNNDAELRLTIWFVDLRGKHTSVRWIVLMWKWSVSLFY